MNSFQKRNHVIDFVFTLALFCIFAACALSVVLIGANVYRSTVNQMSENNSARTALSYTAQRIRQNDSAGQIYLTDLSGTKALALSSTYNEEEYVTYLYQDEQQLKELFTKKNSAVSLSAGEFIADIKTFDISEVREGLYRFTASSKNGELIDLYLHPRSQKGGTVS